MGKHVFVTVGTTKFDPMVEAIDKAAVLSSLSSKGFSSLTAQIGHGQHVPSFPVDPVCLQLPLEDQQSCRTLDTVFYIIFMFVRCHEPCRPSKRMRRESNTTAEREEGDVAVPDHPYSVYTVEILATGRFDLNPRHFPPSCLRLSLYLRERRPPLIADGIGSSQHCRRTWQGRTWWSAMLGLALLWRFLVSAVAVVTTSNDTEKRLYRADIDHTKIVNSFSVRL